MEQLSKRIPINYLQYAASGFPNVYSDVAGTHNLDNLKDADSNIRHVWLLALTAGMAVGAYPKDWTEGKRQMFKKTIDFHYTLVAYMYSAAIKGYENGFPYILTPLSLAFPEDPDVSYLENFQWMIGESIMAAPFLKNVESSKMNIYFPEGIWYDYYTDERMEGPILLKNKEVPLDKVPSFVGSKGIVLERRGT